MATYFLSIPFKKLINRKKYIHIIYNGEQLGKFLKTKSKQTGIPYGCLLSNKEVQNEYKKLKDKSKPPQKSKAKVNKPPQNSKAKDIEPPQKKSIWGNEVNIIKYILSDIRVIRHSSIIETMKRFIKEGVVISPVDLFYTIKDRTMFNHLTERNSLRDIHYVFKDVIESEGGKVKDYNKEEKKKYIKMLDKFHKFNADEDEAKNNEKERTENIINFLIVFFWDEDVVISVLENYEKYKPNIQKIRKLIKEGVVISPADIFVRKEDLKLINEIADYVSIKKFYNLFDDFVFLEEGKIKPYNEEEKKLLKLFRKAIN